MKLIRKLLLALTIGLTMLALVTPANAQGPETDLEVPNGPVTIDERLGMATGRVQVVVRLSDAPLAGVVGPNAKQRGFRMNAAQQRNYLNGLTADQDALMAQISALGGTEVARLSRALNAVVVEIDAEQAGAIAGLQGVTSVRMVTHYEMDLSETVPYIGARAVQDLGYDGTGVTVAVLDSGIDYTHADLGGPGTAAAYEAAWGTDIDDPRNTTRDGLFPTDKVIGGYDFVGEFWPTFSSTTAPDEDPIDFEGHGTHVADIIGGNLGVAPGVKFYAVKVCSAVSSSCNGVALLQGIDFALDPNGDGDISDAVDVLNMSLGSSFGQIQDDLSQASAEAVALGVVIVASAGNSANRPYISGSPSVTPNVISVAQTTVPSDKTFVVQTPAVPAGVQAVAQPWAATPTLTVGQLTYVSTNTGTRLGCSDANGSNPYAAGSLTGKILLVDRGTCAVSFKVSNGAAAGAIAVLVANNLAAGPYDPPPSFSFGGGNPNVPGYTLTLEDGNLLKNTSLGAVATIDPASAVSIVGTTVASTSRGPNHSFDAIKPDIAAPGASLSAEAGTGTGRTAFGGTSGAAPMVSGAAALMVQKYPNLLPHEIKARLMGTAFTGVQNNPVAQPGVLAPISRIGGGEVRVDRAINVQTAAWDLLPETGFAASLSFGYHTVTGPLTLQRDLVLRNYSGSSRIYNIKAEFRYADDAASGAVKVTVPSRISVPGNSQRVIPVFIKIDPSKLPTWTLNGGSLGGDGFRLEGVEFDGYLTIKGGADTITVPWHVLPHKAADLSATDSVEAGGTVVVSHVGGTRSGRAEIFALTGTSLPLPPSAQPRWGEQFYAPDLSAVGVRLIGSNIQFAINTYDDRSHPAYPGAFEVQIDRNQDGVVDVVLYNRENGAFGSTGQTVIAVQNVNPSGPASIFFFADADLNSGNMIMTAPLSALGLTSGTQFSYNVLAYDNYFSGLVSDSISDMVFTAGTPRFAASSSTIDVPVGGSVNVGVSAVSGGASASPSQTGLLLMYRDAPLGDEAETVAVSE